MMNVEAERNRQIDAARGIAILIVVLGHSFYSLDTLFNKVILTFHMPLFFLLSGMVAKTSDMIKIPGRYLLHKLKTILVPQILLGTLSYVYYGLFTVVMKGGNLQDVDFLYQFWRYWFLQGLFIVVVTFYLLSKIVDLNQRSTQVMVISLCLATGLSFSYFIDFPDESPFYLNVVPIALMFYVLGYVFKEFLTCDWKRYFNSTAKNGCLIIVSGIILVMCAARNTSVTMYNNGYGNFALFICGCLSGIVFVWTLAGLMANNRFLIWCGTNSIIIYVWQFILTQFMKNIVEILAGRLYLGCPDTVMAIMVFLLCVAMEIPIVQLSNRFIPEVYGKKRKIKE